MAGLSHIPQAHHGVTYPCPQVYYPIVASNNLFSSLSLCEQSRRHSQTANRDITVTSRVPFDITVT